MCNNWNNVQPAGHYKEQNPSTLDQDPSDHPIGVYFAIITVHYPFCFNKRIDFLC